MRQQNIKIYKFEKRGCGPCRMAGMVSQKIADKCCVGRVSFDIFENEDMLTKYNIKSVPTVIVVNENGEELKRLVNFGEIAAQLEKTVMELR